MRPVYEEGAVGLGLLIRRLQTTASVLHVGAHPDDEDSALIARLARFDGARVAYLSLNRGEGGQNRIGPELFDALGVIRTEELLQARRLDGGEQFFARTFDFGFTKTRAEAAARWGEREVLGDMVRVIRSFRPLVVVSRWKGTADDGHGQHQLAGHLAPLAFRAAADPAEFPEQLAEGLRPWQAQKFYVSDNGRAGEVAGLARAETGAHDPLTGRSPYELALEGRSQHKSQEQGALELRGPQTSGVRLVERAPGAAQSAAAERGLFGGLDTSVRGIPRAAGFFAGDSLNESLREIERDAKDAAEKFNALDPRTVVAALGAGLAHTREARAALARTRDKTARAEADFLLARKEREFSEALRLALGVRVDALADAETVTPGESFTVAVRAYVPDESGAAVGRLSLRAPKNWRVEEIPAPERNAALQTGRETPTRAAHFRVTVPLAEQPTQPYWLDDARRGDLYSWEADDPKSQPFAPALLVAEAAFETGAGAVTFERPVEHRRPDAVRGELRREINVVPEIDVQLEPKLVVVPRERAAARGETLEFSVGLTNNVARTTEGAGEAVATGGAGVSQNHWRQTPAAHDFRLDEKGERVLLKTKLHLPRGVKAGEYKLRAAATASFRAAPRRGPARRFDRGEQAISYPHIQTHRRFLPQEARVLVLDLRVAPVRVGYVMGSGDEVPAAIERMGLKVTQLSESDLAAGDLSRFDTIVVGVRASQTRPDFAANHKRLAEFAGRGGAVIVQYQRPDYAERNLAPFPATMQTRDARGAQTISRVVDENAPVRVLERAHPAFNFPNRIGEADWRGWVQERNLYNFITHDARFVPLLEAHDAGEPENTGGMVYARVGRGHYVYTSYAFFRQLPAGVPGAYRLFANLLSLPKASAAKPPPPKWRFRRIN
ncbi:MAG: PIG-L family deacetylase [Acidobacteria bacterium]|nr:PIG-L family deacetylase [Acidobacteriota bacterium]